jgi:hypothetical protein
MRLCTARMSSDENVTSLFRPPRPLSPLLMKDDKHRFGFEFQVKAPCLFVLRMHRESASETLFTMATDGTSH